MKYMYFEYDMFYIPVIKSKLSGTKEIKVINSCEEPYPLQPRKHFRNNIYSIKIVLFVVTC